MIKSPDITKFTSCLSFILISISVNIFATDTKLVLHNLDNSVSVTFNNNGNVVSNKSINPKSTLPSTSHSFAISKSSDLIALVNKSGLSLKGASVPNSNIPLGDLSIHTTDKTASLGQAGFSATSSLNFYGALLAAGTTYGENQPFSTVAYVDDIAVFESNGAGAPLAYQYANIVTPYGIEGKTLQNDIGLGNTYYIKDHLGSTRMAFKEDGAIVDNVFYTAYGKVSEPFVNSPDQTKAREKFTGKEFDQEGKVDGAEISHDIKVVLGLDNRYSGSYKVTFSDGTSETNAMQLTDNGNGGSSNFAFQLVYKVAKFYEGEKTISNLTIAVTNTHVNTTFTYSYDVNETTILNNKREIKLDRDLAEIVAADGASSKPDLYEPDNVYASNGVPGIQLDYFGARYYDPEIGAFTSADPAEQFLNSYSYCGGNPVSTIDPDGQYANLVAEGNAKTEKRQQVFNESSSAHQENWGNSQSLTDANIDDAISTGFSSLQGYKRDYNDYMGTKGAGARFASALKVGGVLSDRDFGLVNEFGKSDYAFNGLDLNIAMSNAAGYSNSLVTTGGIGLYAGGATGSWEASGGGISPAYAIGGLVLVGTSEISVPVLLVGGVIVGTAVLMSGEWKKGQLYDPTLDNYLNGFRNLDPLKPKPPGDPGKWGKAAKWGVAGWLAIEAINKANGFIDYLTTPVPSPTPQPKSPELRKR